MKKGKLWLVIVSLVWSLLLFPGFANAQNDWEGGDPDIYYTGGNVGIGTANPQEALDVNGIIVTPGGNSVNWDTAYGWGDHAAEGYLTSVGEIVETDPQVGDLTENYVPRWSDGATALIDSTIYDNNGYVGIGTTDPSAKGIEVVNTGTGAQFFANRTDGATMEFSASANAGIIGTRNNKELRFRVNVYNAMVITTSRNIGIGTNTPGYKLDVAGKIHAQEIKVDLNGADFVFEEDYELRSLDQVEQYIAQNKHLPDIPPAKEIETEGIGLGEMQTRLLQKVEELTLYVIEQEKRIEELEKTRSE